MIFSVSKPMVFSLEKARHILSSLSVDYECVFQHLTKLFFLLHALGNTLLLVLDVVDIHQGLFLHPVGNFDVLSLYHLYSLGFEVGTLAFDSADVVSTS